MAARGVNDILLRVAQDFGTPCYVYFVDQIRERVQALRGAFGGRFLISYAMKCNPHPGLVARMRSIVDAIDVSSAGEISIALDAGWPAAQLGFTGPGKTAAELCSALERGVGELIVESIDEAELLNRTAERLGVKQSILVRIAPRQMPRGFGLSMSGKSTQFGIDEEEITAAVRTVQSLSHLDLGGFHIYAGTQCLKAAALIESFELFADLFRRVCHAGNVTPRRLVFGAGMGIPCFENETGLDLDLVAPPINKVLDQLKGDARFGSTRLVLESGRYLVGEAGIYVIRVIRMKHSRGTDICICDGGMNQHLVAAGHFGNVVQRNYQMFKITAEPEESAESPFTLVGPLCTTLDTLGRDVKLAAMRSGDLVGLRCSGAYGLTASPTQFISHPLPKEIIVETVQGEICVEDHDRLAAAQKRLDHARQSGIR